MTLPDDLTFCIGLGAQRAGTTWLATYFAQHPSIFMSPIKELHYFDALWRPDLMGRRSLAYLEELQELVAGLDLEEVRDRSDRWRHTQQLARRLDMVGGGHEAYLEYFSSQVGEEAVAAEITPSYSVLDAGHLREIRSLHRRVKVIYIMRNPIDRVWSLLRHRERKGGFKLDRDFDATITSPGVMERSDYAHTLAALDAAFPPEDVFIGFYERLFNETSIRSLCRFLGIPHEPAPLQTRVAKARERPITAEQRRRIGELLQPVYDHCRARFGDRLPERWNADIAFLEQAGRGTGDRPS